MLRIIGGMARSRKLLTPLGMGTRPTADRIRESLFNMLGTRCIDARVLDLFAGSGALGLEALSRGAQSVVLIERDKEAAKIIERNIQAVQLPGAHLVNADAFAALQRFDSDRFDIIFVDPPYAQGVYERVLYSLGAYLAPSGVMIVEHALKQPLELTPGWVCTQMRTYGITALSFLQREG